MIDRSAAAPAIDAFLRAIGRDPAAETELAETAERVTDAFVDELCNGYDVDVPALLRTHTLEQSTEWVVARDLAVVTVCPHHLLPAVGKATVAFAPSTKIVGIGVLGKVVDAFAHRLVLQETIGEQVTEALMEQLQPKWAGCLLALRHTCMMGRGGRKHDAEVETVSIRGSLTSQEKIGIYEMLRRRP